MIAVLDYGIGNLRSAEKALLKVGADARLVTDPDEAALADAIVLPGVGSFGACVSALRNSGMHHVLYDAIAQSKPLLGICVGFQMLFSESEESPGVAGLGIMDGAVLQMPTKEKLPQMQWNRLNVLHPDTSLMFRNLKSEELWFYFVHSYAAYPIGGLENPTVAAYCDYGGDVVAAIESGCLWATQFHPEKSGTSGLALLSRFVAFCEGVRQ
ncbi:MAG: imidazole glycerol phosphate synthase subunit HisH [Firmicutes bacterium]|nr:imidazole glycerol phosphate synthase subunit HisH [Bacillota bacterium]